MPQTLLQRTPLLDGDDIDLKREEIRNYFHKAYKQGIEQETYVQGHRWGGTQQEFDNYLAAVPKKEVTLVRGAYEYFVAAAYEQLREQGYKPLELSDLTGKDNAAKFHL